MSKLFDELSALKEAYDTKLEEEGEEALKELFKDFFEKYPSAKAITWRQYTPYFNDGDPCYFRVGEMNLHLDEDEDEDDYDDYDGYDSYGLKNSDDDNLKAMAADFEVLEGIPEDVLEYVFGDHVTITATRDGFKVREYDHD